MGADRNVMRCNPGCFPGWVDNFDVSETDLFSISLQDIEHGRRRLNRCYLFGLFSQRHRPAPGSGANIQCRFTWFQVVQNIIQERVFALFVPFPGARFELLGAFFPFERPFFTGCSGFGVGTACQFSPRVAQA